MSVSATVSSQPISATVSGDRIAASVPAAASVAASVAGGVGPQGPQGDAAGSLDQLDDVTLVSPADGDLLRYANGQWRNQPERNLTIDGENF